jgi:hypothetical protein
MAAITASRILSRWRAALLVAGALFVAMMVLGASSAQAWRCSPTGARPWQHYTHYHYDPFRVFYYIDGHTHSWGDHHHIWDVAGGGYVIRYHTNCGDDVVGVPAEL